MFEIISFQERIHVFLFNFAVFVLFCLLVTKSHQWLIPFFCNEVPNNLFALNFVWRYFDFLLFNCFFFKKGHWVLDVKFVVVFCYFCLCCLVVVILTGFTGERTWYYLPYQVIWAGSNLFFHKPIVFDQYVRFFSNFSISYSFCWQLNQNCG